MEREKKGERRERERRGGGRVDLFKAEVLSGKAKNSR